MLTFAIYLKYLWKRKILWPHNSNEILHQAQVFTVDQMLSRTLDTLYFCAT